MSKEGSLEAPKRHPIDWNSPDYLNKDLLDQEMERQMDVCHGCRRCFNLCGSFPKLFDLIDESTTGELDSVSKDDYPLVVDDCTLCDMCFLTKCPYVPPHPFNLDFPHLMLRYKAFQHSQGGTPFIKEQLAQVDRNAKLFQKIAPLVNAVNQEGAFARPALEKVTHIDARASIPKFAGKTLVKTIKDDPMAMNPTGLALGEKIVLYATCYGNYNETQLGVAALRILAHLGVDVRLEYPGCCGMPQLELGNVARVAKGVGFLADFFAPFIADGRKIVTLVPSCTLMLKNEGPALHTHNEAVSLLQKNTYDISEYIVYLLTRYGTPAELTVVDQPITLQLACHARAQNIGAKGAEMLRFIPNAKVSTIERCSGHGGTWGMMADHFDTALKVGAPVVKQAIKLNTPAEGDVNAAGASAIISSECPLAATHIVQGLERLNAATSFIKMHPLEIMAKALGLV